jgi:hypothetical protein
MKVQIISSTDGQFLGKIIQDVFPTMLDDNTEFMPSGDPILVGGQIKRYFNSNYSIDVQEYKDNSALIAALNNQ